MNDGIKEILDGFKEILDNPTTTDECYDGRIIEVDRSYDLYLDEIKALLDYITNLQQENKGLKEELNRMFNRKVNAIKYIGREMIHDALYPASKVDGMKIIELLNGGDE